MITWTEVLRCTVGGAPVAKQRPRTVRIGRGPRTRTYTPKKTLEYENRVAVAVQLSRRWRRTDGVPLLPSGTPVRVDIVAVFPRPKARHRKADPVGLLPKASRPDLDNVVKAAIDGCDGAHHLWHDDGQVQCIRAEAWYAEVEGHPRTEIIVYAPEGWET